MVFARAKYGVLFHRGCKKGKKRGKRHRDDSSKLCGEGEGGKSSMIGFVNDVVAGARKLGGVEIESKNAFLLTRDLNCKCASALRFRLRSLFLILLSLRDVNSNF